MTAYARDFIVHDLLSSLLGVKKPQRIVAFTLQIGFSLARDQSKFPVGSFFPHPMMISIAPDKEKRNSPGAFVTSACLSRTVCHSDNDSCGSPEAIFGSLWHTARALMDCGDHRMERGCAHACVGLRIAVDEGGDGGNEFVSRGDGFPIVQLCRCVWHPRGGDTMLVSGP